MKKLVLFAALAAFATGPAFAQTAAPAAAGAAAKTPAAVGGMAKDTATGAAKDAATGMAKDKASGMAKEAVGDHKAKAPRTAKSLECSKQADTQSLHGKARKKFMSSCKKG